MGGDTMEIQRLKMRRETSSKKSRPRNQRGEGTKLRHELVDAAIRLLARMPTDAAISLRAVAKEANVSAPSVYLHFKNLDEIVFAVLETLFFQQIQLRNDAEETAARRGGLAFERLLARSVSLIEWGLKNPGHYKVLFEGRIYTRFENPKIMQLGRPLLTRTSELIQETRLQQKLAPLKNVDEVSALLWACLHGIVSVQINKPTLKWGKPRDLALQVMQALVLSQPGAPIGPNPRSGAP
jgi:AcrR family transcriptional regulator